MLYALSFANANSVKRLQLADQTEKENEETGGVLIGPPFSPDRYGGINRPARGGISLSRGGDHRHFRSVLM